MSKRSDSLQQETCECAVEDDRVFPCKSCAVRFTAAHQFVLEEEQLAPSNLPGFGPFPTCSAQVPWATGGEAPQPLADGLILPSPESEQDQLTRVTQLTSTGDLCCFPSACFALSWSQEVQGVEEGKNQVYENVKLLLCYSHKATVSLMARSDYLVSQIGSLHCTQIGDYLLWAGS